MSTNTSGGGGRKRDAIWLFYEKPEESTKRQCCCKSCGAVFYPDTKRMKQHILNNCETATERMKETVRTNTIELQQPFPSPHNVHRNNPPRGKASSRACASLLLPPSLFDNYYDKETKELYDKAGLAVFATAKVAGVQGAKQTSQLFPYSFNAMVDKCEVSIVANPDRHVVEVYCYVNRSHKSMSEGVSPDLDALTGSTIAALCIFNLCNDLSPDGIVIQHSQLVTTTTMKYRKTTLMKEEGRNFEQEKVDSVDTAA